MTQPSKPIYSSGWTGRDQSEQAKDQLTILIAGDFMFQVGHTYETQAGDMVSIISRPDDSEYYGNLECSDGFHRYDRKGYPKDAGRVCGTAHDYSDAANFKREDRPLVRNT